MKNKRIAASFFLSGLCLSLILTGCGQSNSSMSSDDAANFKGKAMTPEESAQKMQAVDARMKTLQEEQAKDRAKAGLPPAAQTAPPPAAPASGSPR